MSSHSVFKIMNLYSFVRTHDDKTDTEYVKKRIDEYKMTAKLRDAVTFCKKINNIYTNDLSKITNKEKDDVESCLKENFIKENPDYFGKRDVIYIDLHNYS
jgi:hypothetical protein